jgi:hypothetical protein
VDGAANNGFGIRADNTADGWSVNTTGAATDTNHPKLNVTYTTDPNVRIKSYQQGIDGYDGTVDVFPNGNSGGSAGTVIDGSTVDQGFLDGYSDTGSPDAPYFIRFDNIDLNYNSIYKAELIMKTGFSSTSADTPGTYSVHQSLIDFDTMTTYVSLDSDGDSSLNDAAELVSGGTVAPAAATPTNIEDGEVVHIDVTSIVKNWHDGAANQGIYIGAAGTDNGWQIFASGAANPEFAPELRIIGVVPEPGTIVLLLSVTSFVVRWRRARR